MIWGILILVCLIFLVLCVLIEKLNAINEKLAGRLLINGDVRLEKERPEEPTSEEIENAEKSRQQDWKAKEARLHRLKQEVEKKPGGWRKAPIVSRRRDANLFREEYVFITPDRTYTVSTFLQLGGVGDEVEYAIGPGSPSDYLYMRSPNGEVSELDIVHEKLRRSAIHTPGVLFE